MIKRIRRDEIPSEIREKLDILRKEVKEYVIIGENYYEVKPLSIVKMTFIINELTKLINKIRGENVDLTNPDSQRYVSLQEILSSDEFREKFISILQKIFEGVDPVDFDSMTLPQFNDLLSKIVSVNLNSFPDEKSKQDFISKLVMIALLINPKLYTYFMNTQFMDDLNIILTKNPELQAKINEELMKLYAERSKSN